MLLRSLKLFRGSEYAYAPDPTKPLVGEVEFWSEAGDKIAIRLTEESAKRILDIVADGLIQASRKVANDLTAEIITQTLPLPGQGKELTQQ